MKIIIVDDDCLVAGALKTILEANPDIEVTATGSDGEEACSLYREYLPDILLMDIRMKGMDGLEASSSSGGLLRPDRIRHRDHIQNP